MFSSQKQSEILDVVRVRGACRINDLARELKVSGETIRRHVKPLVARGLVTRVHGGVMLPETLEEEPPFQRRMLENQHAKRRIAAVVAGIVRDGDSLMMDTGSTTAYVALALRDHKNLLVVTNCVEIARTLATRNGNRVHMTGGELRSDDAAAFGPAAIAFVRQFEVQYAILSIGAISESAAFMNYHLCESEFSRAVMAQADRTLLVADESKFGKRAPIRVCEADGVDTLITDVDPGGEFIARLRSAGVDVRVALSQSR